MHRKFFILPILLITILFAKYVFASDPCKDIEDLDDKADCYAKEIDEKQQEYESTAKKLEDVKTQKDGINQKISELSSQLNITQEQIDDLQADIDSLNTALDEIQQNLVDRNEKLQEKITFRNKVIRNYTKRGMLNDLEIFLLPVKLPSSIVTSSGVTIDNLSGLQYSTLSYIYKKSLTEDAVNIIGVINSEIQSFEKDKKETEDLKNEVTKSQEALLATKLQMENQKQAAANDASDLENKEGAYESELQSLSEKIADLSSKQQEILKKKYGDEYGSVGDYESPSWEVPEPPFKPAFGVFSYGAYTHYKGMSQYGAKGRAEDGQDYKDIIEFYYDNSVKEEDDFPDEVCVQGYGDMDFQEYLYGLAEMPSDWPEDALKAQAIAGRTYAYRYHKAGNCICTSESCQVFLQSKSDNPPDRWKQAVDDTKDMIIEGDVHAMYSSTTGGYIESIGWDTDGSWPNNAYEKKAESPWFYWAWYSSNYRFDSDTCGRSHPWLNEEEMADILNAAVVLNHGPDSRVSPITTDCWGGNPYSMNSLRDRAEEIDKGYKKVTGVSVDIGNDGKTKNVTFSTDNGSINMSGETFKEAFNLRAPAYISIRSRIFDIQHEN